MLLMLREVSLRTPACLQSKAIAEPLLASVVLPFMKVSLRLLLFLSMLLPLPEIHSFSLSFNYIVFLCKDTSHVNGLLTVRGVACF